ncbi:MAG: hypothetical protein RL497_1320, partial [Pseudomonadota bacterium]
MNKYCALILLASAQTLHAEPAYVWQNGLTLESIHALSGGVEKGSAQLANLDVTLAINTAAAGGWENGEVFVYVLADYGKNPAELTGGVQGISNIAADVNTVKLYEFWYQHEFPDAHLKILTGLHDFNSTFYALESAGLFTHPSFG